MTGLVHTIAALAILLTALSWSPSRSLPFLPILSMVIVFVLPVGAPTCWRGSVSDGLKCCHCSQVLGLKC